MYDTIGDNQERYIVEIKLTTKCNYNCYYCTSDPDIGMPGHNNKNRISAFNLTNICELINTIKLVTNRSVDVFIYGGEPTLHPDLVNIVNTINSNLDESDSIDILTNMSKPIKWFDKFISKINKPINVTIHGSYHRTQTSYLSYVTKCVKLKSASMLGLVTVMLSNRDIQSTMSDFNNMKTLLGSDHCEMSLLTTVNNTVGSREIDQIYSELDEDVRSTLRGVFDNNIKVDDRRVSKADIWYERSNKYLGYMCSVGLDKINIDWNGDCYYCCNDYYSDAPPIFNINTCDFGTIRNHVNNLKCVCCPYKCCVFDIEYRKTKTNLKIPSRELNRLDA